MNHAHGVWTWSPCIFGMIRPYASGFGRKEQKVVLQTSKVAQQAKGTNLHHGFTESRTCTHFIGSDTHCCLGAYGVSVLGTPWPGYWIFDTS
jgi:hypothetical protein